ncbi:MAG: hypothetical protein A2Z96_05170 [Spirochaetes bacterium GWB1_48_6]|nr:MAG: hypothetical protein A2Z96_05170 [Spirochaetes bacterium GWB1_48_6]
MEKNILKFLRKSILILGALLFCSCSDVQDGVQVILGNYSFQQGEFQKASLQYFSVLKTGRHEAWVMYNLGNVFYALGESAAALEVWDGITGETYEDLQFRLAFNRAHLYYQRGLYQEAYLQFKKALKIKPRNLETKRNLELTLLKIQALSSSLSPPKDTGRSTLNSGSGSTMLEYVKQIESTRWKSNKKIDIQPASRDW